MTLAVEDAGPGIPADERDRIFDRFHRATDAGTGAGLGLAIADGIVRATHGRWRVGTSSAGRRQPGRQLAARAGRLERGCGPPGVTGSHPPVVTGSKGSPAETAGMDTKRPAPLDLAARDRATRRLNQLTTGVALAGAIAVVGFGALAAATDSGTATSATTTTTTTSTTDTSTSGTTSTTPSLGSGVAPQPATGPADVTTGGS